MPKNNGLHRKAQRRGIAEANRLSRANSTNQEQIELLAMRPGNSTKEITRLTKSLEG